MRLEQKLYYAWIDHVQSLRSWVKVYGPRGPNWTVKKSESGRSSTKLDAPKDGNMDGKKVQLNITKVWMWTTRKSESRRSKKFVVNGQKDS